MPFRIQSSGSRWSAAPSIPDENQSSKADGQHGRRRWRHGLIRVMVRQSQSGTRSGGRIFRIFPSLQREAEWFAWIVVELLGTRLLRRWPELEGRYSLLDLINWRSALVCSIGPCRSSSHCGLAHARCFSRARRLALCWFRFCPRPTAYKIMNCAARDLKLAFLHEYPRDLAICPSAPTQFVDQLAVRFQAGARRFLRQAVEDNL